LALNITFTCNEVVDENENAINCKYQVYYPEHNLWNDVRDTELYQYNCNAGDGDALTQTGSFLSGQHAVIVFWQGDGAGGATGLDRFGLKDRMAFYVITYDGVTSTYVIDVQLKPKTAPDCSWYLSTSGTINREKTAYSYANDDYNWSYNETTLYHNRSYSSEIIFDSVGNLVIEFDFDDGDGYEATNVHTYTVVADYNPSHKATNQYSLSSECFRTIRMKYNTPIGCLNFTPDGVNEEVQTGDDVTTTACITDEDSRITGIDYHWIIKDRNNNGTIIRDTTVDNNTDLSYSYTSTILELQDTFGYEYISWNDGWEDFTITTSKEIAIKNINPIVDISKVDLSSKEKRFVQVSSDEDGSVVSWSWKIYLLMPFSSEWVEVYSLTNDGSSIDITFNEAGKYKTEITVQDDYGKYSTRNSTVAGISSAEIEFDVTAAGECTGTSTDEVFFIFPDVIGDGIE